MLFFCAEKISTSSGIKWNTTETIKSTELRSKDRLVEKKILKGKIAIEYYG